VFSSYATNYYDTRAMNPSFFPHTVSCSYLNSKLARWRTSSRPFFLHLPNLILTLILSHLSRDGVRSTMQRPQVSLSAPRQCCRHYLQVCLASNSYHADPDWHSHVFCAPCADTSGLSRSTNTHRTCPACGASLQNPDDVVVAGLNPSEDYKTSVLSGLSPTIIMECASRGLAFHSYQTSQEIIYQDHLAKGLTEKYNTLSQQMDQLIHDANSQIKALQEKMQSRFFPIHDCHSANVSPAMQGEHAALEEKNHELGDAFRQKASSLQQVTKLYQSLKAQVMASHVAHAAGNEAEMTINTARGDRFIDRLPGTRTSTANYSQMGISQRNGGGRPHNRTDSKSSGDSGQQRQGLGLSQHFAPHMTERGLGGRMGTGRKSLRMNDGTFY
jgi:hypothetical protein